MEQPSKLKKYHYRRNLPHMQGTGQPLFVTFRTFQSFILPEEVREDVLGHCLYDHQKRIVMRCAIIMPDHVHLIFWCRRDAEGIFYSLQEILNGIKGASAHSVNRTLGRKGHVWQDESLDHVIRSDQSLGNLVEYVANNPVRKGLALTPRDYPWYWAQSGLFNYVPREHRSAGH